MHVPPPAVHLCLSGSRAQGNGDVTGSLRSVNGSEGGKQVASVKKSTSLRTKIRGKVPPRLETLYRKISQLSKFEVPKG